MKSTIIDKSKNTVIETIQISNDQSLPTEDLLQQVLSFSTLYKTILVIAAYDMPRGCETFSNTVFRLWICGEARLFRNNATKFTYVGYDADRGGARYEYGNYLDQLILSKSLLVYLFRQAPDIVWTGGIMRAIAGVLFGEIGMADIADFKFIISPLAPALVTAHRTMSRNDYLLTAILLCTVYAEDGVHTPRDITHLTFNRYTFNRIGQRDECSGFLTFKDILLDGVPVGVWKYNDTDYLEIYTHFVEASDDGAATEARILDRLPMTDADRRLYAEQEAQRRAFIRLGNMYGPPPVVEIVFFPATR